jgi:hypothetical protein
MLQEKRRMEMGPSVLTVEQEKAKAAKTRLSERRQRCRMALLTM